MRIAILSLLLTLGAMIAPCVAQSMPEEQKAVLVFDVRMDMLTSSPLGKQMKFAEMMTGAQEKSGQGGADPAKLRRIFGAVSAPKSMSDFELSDPSKEVPFEFFMRAEYQDSESASVAFKDAIKNAEKVEKNGQTFYKGTDGRDMPPGALLHQVQETTLEMGTETYLLHPNRKLFTDNLQTAWNKAPDEAIRMAMDVKGAQSLIAELIEEGKKTAPDPTFEAYYDLIDNVSHMGISLDLTGANLLSIRATALDAAQGQELKDGLDSLLFIAQSGGKQALPMIGEMAPKAKPVVESILDSLVAKNNAEEVTIVIPKPNGFESAVAEAAQIIPAMFFGGGGPPPGAMGGPGEFSGDPTGGGSGQKSGDPTGGGSGQKSGDPTGGGSGQKSGDPTGGFSQRSGDPTGGGSSKK